MNSVRVDQGPFYPSLPSFMAWADAIYGLYWPIFYKGPDSLHFFYFLRDHLVLALDISLEALVVCLKLSDLVHE